MVAGRVAVGITKMSGGVQDRMGFRASFRVLLSVEVEDSSRQVS